MYSYPPTPGDISFSNVGNQINANISHTSQETPKAAEKLLRSLGWQTMGVHPDSHDTLWNKPNNKQVPDYDNDLAQGIWHWYEAIAYEFTKFITIGEDSGQRS